MREGTGTYQPGEWMAVARNGCWVLLESKPDEELLEETWELLATESGPARLSELLSERAGRIGRGFAAAWTDGSATVIVVGGAGLALVDTDDGPVKLMSLPAVSSSHFRLPPANRATLVAETAASGSRFPIMSGVAAASALVVEWSGSVANPPAEVGARPAIPAVAQEPPDEPTAAPGVAPVVSDPGATLHEGWDGRVEPVAATLDLEPDPMPAIPASPEDDQPTRFDHLFGLTMHRSVEGAAIRVGSDALRTADEPVAEAPATDEPVAERPTAAASEERPSTQPPAGLLEPSPVWEDEPSRDPGGPVTPAAPSPAGADSRGSPGPTGLIDAVPGGAVRIDAPSSTTSAHPHGDRSEVASSDGGDRPPEDEMELTVNRAVLLDHLTASAPPVQGPTVHAVRCPVGHANPAQAVRCRICGEAVPDQPPTTVPRPLLGYLRISTGERIPLDRSVLLGRSPSADRPVQGERPHLVKLPSPGQELSRDHLEVRLDGWHVLVTDLGSTNGTLIVRPGQAPERLRPDQPTMIEAGTVINLADVVACTFEVDG